VAVALRNWSGPDVAEMRRLYRERRDACVAGLRAIGCEVDTPSAGFFVWARTPLGGDGKPVDSMTFASRLLTEADVVVVPGAGFSAAGRDYFRIALTVEADRLRAAADRMKAIDWSVRPR
jgi:LL-diaminopimelate aminotransferase